MSQYLKSSVTISDENCIPSEFHAAQQTNLEYAVLIEDAAVLCEAAGDGIWLLGGAVLRAVVDPLCHQSDVGQDVPVGDFILHEQVAGLPGRGYY